MLAKKKERNVRDNSTRSLTLKDKETEEQRWCFGYLWLTIQNTTISQVRKQPFWCHWCIYLVLPLLRLKCEAPQNVREEKV
jgi:hypothetical protein